MGFHVRCYLGTDTGGESAITTITDVARLAGVSKTTVSRVLNRPDSVKPDKRAAVVAAIAELHFRPNRTAQSLKSRSFGSIALVVSDISNAFFAEIVRSVERRCALSGFSIVLCNLDNEPDRLERFLEGLPQRGVDGLIICGSAFLQTDNVVRLLQDLSRHDLPLVISGHEIPELDVPTVVNTTDAAIEAALAHLWHTGRRVVCYLGESGQSPIATDRLRRFTTLALSRGFVTSERSIRHSSYDFFGGFDGAQELLLLNPDLDALLCGGDQIAIGAMRGLEERGKVIPGDIAVIGFDDTSLARFSSPGLSSIAVHIEQTGEAAAEKIIAAINGESFRPRTFIDAELIVRESSQVA